MNILIYFVLFDCFIFIHVSWQNILKIWWKKKQECEHIFIKEKAKLHFISGRELLYKKRKNSDRWTVKISPHFYCFQQFHLWLLLLAPCFDTPCEPFPLQTQTKTWSTFDTHKYQQEGGKVPSVSCETLTSLSDFLRCSFPYPAVGTCHHEGPSIQVYIQVSWNKMLCCCFIATPGTSKEECVSTLHCHPYFYMHWCNSVITIGCGY